MNAAWNPQIVWTWAEALAALCVLYCVLRRSRLRALTDSPWYWAVLFSGMGLIGMIVIGAKYERREAALELKAIGRERAVPSASPHVSISGTPDLPMREMDPGAIAADENLDRPPEKLKKPLDALVLILAAVLAVSLVQLIREGKALAFTRSAKIHDVAI